MRRDKAAAAMKSVAKCSSLMSRQRARLFLSVVLFLLATTTTTSHADDEVPSPRCGISTQTHQASRMSLRNEGNAAPREFPWLVSIQMLDSNASSWNHICAGSLIDRHWIFTAAHCVDTRLTGHDPIRVVVGAFDLALSKTTEASWAQELGRSRDIAIHPSWNGVRKDYDYALIQLPTALDFGGEHSSLAPICIPSSNDTDVEHSEPCVVAGWSDRTESDSSSCGEVLQKLPVKVQLYEDCKRMWFSEGSAHGGIILTERHMCAEFVSDQPDHTCHTGSGSPLQCRRSARWHLAGIASFAGKERGIRTQFDVYARVAAVLQWVERVKTIRTRDP